MTEYSLRAILRALWCALLGCLLFGSTVAESATEVEQAVKAAYLYRFLGYVHWPPQALPQRDAPYVIGVSAGPAMLDALREVAQRHQVNGRHIKVLPVKAGDALAGIHLLYVETPDQPGERALLKQARQYPILTVADEAGNGAMGCIIGFRIIDDRVRFDIALDAARKRGLTLSSRLLSVAANVQAGETQ